MLLDYLKNRLYNFSHTEYKSLKVLHDSREKFKNVLAYLPRLRLDNSHWRGYKCVYILLYIFTRVRRYPHKKLFFILQLLSSSFCDLFGVIFLLFSSFFMGTYMAINKLENYRYKVATMKCIQSLQLCIAFSTYVRLQLPFLKHNKLFRAVYTHLTRLLINIVSY